jgi:hypothetical protein
VQARCWTGILHCIHGRTDQALALREIDPLGPYPYAMTGLCLLQAQRPEDADPFLDQALAFDADNILALRVIDRACDEKQLLVSFTGLPGFDLLRADPRFGAFMLRMGLPSAASPPDA